MNDEKENIIVWIIEDNEYFRTTIEELLNSTQKFECRGGYGSCEEAIFALQVESHPRMLFY